MEDQFLIEEFSLFSVICIVFLCTLSGASILDIPGVSISLRYDRLRVLLLLRTSVYTFNYVRLCVCWVVVDRMRIVMVILVFIVFCDL